MPGKGRLSGKQDLDFFRIEVRELLTFVKIKLMNTAESVYDQIAEFMANMDTNKVIAFKASAENQKRLDYLLDKQKESGLTKKERNELEHYLIINRIIGLAKARARHALNQ